MMTTPLQSLTIVMAPWVMRMATKTANSSPEHCLLLSNQQPRHPPFAPVVDGPGAGAEPGVLGVPSGRIRPDFPGLAKVRVVEPVALNVPHLPAG